ncbi:hypothetical protein BBP40_007254 [Aspergillus hancockii]|nr:hypothetical protein BBP40_007254 [Aspergillus hancockii]
MQIQFKPTPHATAPSRRSLPPQSPAAISRWEPPLCRYYHPPRIMKKSPVEPLVVIDIIHCRGPPTGNPFLSLSKRRRDRPVQESPQTPPGATYLWSALRIFNLLSGIWTQVSGSYPYLSLDSLSARHPFSGTTRLFKLPEPEVPLRRWATTSRLHSRGISGSSTGPGRTNRRDSRGGLADRLPLPSHDASPGSGTWKHRLFGSLYFERFRPYWLLIRRGSFNQYKEKTPLCARSVIVIGRWASGEQSAQSAALDPHKIQELAVHQQKGSRRQAC